MNIEGVGEVQVRFGFPEYWEHAYQQYSAFLERAPRLQDGLNGVTNRSYENVGPLEKVILNLSMLVGVGLVEVVTLVCNGLGRGAMKVVRGMIGNAINAEYLRLNPAECDDYMEWHWIEQHRLYIWMKGRSPQQLSNVPFETIKASEAAYERARSRFEYATPKGERKLRARWCTNSLDVRAQQTGFAETYRAVHPIACQILHGTVGGLFKYFDVGVDEHRIAAPPSDTWGREALVAGHECALRALDTVCKTFNVEPEPSLETLGKDFMAIWGKPQQKAGGPPEELT